MMGNNEIKASVNMIDRDIVDEMVKKEVSQAGNGEGESSQSLQTPIVEKDSKIRGNQDEDDKVSKHETGLAIDKNDGVVFPMAQSISIPIDIETNATTTASGNSMDTIMKDPSNQIFENSDEENPEEMIRELISSLEALQMRIDEVIAFPTITNFKKLHHQGSSTHHLYTQTSRMVELGDIHQQPNQSVVIDAASKAKLSSFGTNMWLNVQNYPEVFRDSVSSSTTTTIPQDGKHDSLKTQEIDLEKERAMASSYTRSLACRLILISKIRTKGLTIPCLVSRIEAEGKEEPNRRLNMPLATKGELEFAFKCLCRAGRAILQHSSSGLDSSLLPNIYDPSDAYSILSLALVFWEGIDKVQLVNKDSGNNCLFIDEAFDTMLSLPDSATLFYSNEKCTNHLGNETASDICSDKECLVLEQLKRLETFVNSQVLSEDKSITNHLKSVQHYLPSLARISYKHGNRFARQSDFTSSQEALRISLCSTDKCLSMINETLHSTDSRDEVTDNVIKSFQIQEQEMLVLSKQCFYVMSHVCKSVGKIDEAKKCLDKIEIYIDEQKQKDSEQYKDAMKRITKSDKYHTENIGSNLSGFALEGPKKQDIAEIKARLLTAKSKSKYGEMMERMNLSYCRIMIYSKNPTGINVDEEKQIDNQFQSMMKIVRDVEASNFDASTRGETQSINSYAVPSKQRNAFDLALSAARFIFIRRHENKCINGHCEDPYITLFNIYPKVHKKNMLIQLEFLNTLLVLIEDSKRQNNHNKRHCDDAIEHRAIDAGKEIVTQLNTLMNEMTNKANDKMDTSTLFSSNKENPHTDFERIVKYSKEYFARAVSLYYSTNEEYDKTIEWCNLLMEIIRKSEQFVFVSNQDSESKLDCRDQVMSGVMATKALSLSMTNSHGAAIKTAREAWEKYSADIGNLVTLFHCSVQFEGFSDSDESNTGTFDNSFLELDNAISTFSSLSKLTTSEAGPDKLLDAFPVLCNTAVQIEPRKVGPLLLGIQRRYTDLLVNYVENVTKASWSSDINTKVYVPGENNVFGVLCSYLGNFDSILTSVDYQFCRKWYFMQLQSLQSTLAKVLKLLCALRDQGTDNNITENENSLEKFAKSFKDDAETQSPIDIEPVLLLDTKQTNELIGKSADCLWIAEQLWNIATQITSEESLLFHGHTNTKLLAADLFSKAHDFALLSEEECNAFLTKGFLACENFDGSKYTEKHIDFTSKSQVPSTDICSEFSAQCLLLNVAHMVDHHMNENMKISSETSSDDTITVEQELQLSSTMNCLIAAMSEIQVLGTDMNSEVIEQVKWLALTLLIALRNDVFCSRVLKQHGLLNLFEDTFVGCVEQKMTIDDDCHNGTETDGDDDMAHLLRRLFYLISLAENYSLNESTKILLILCAKYISPCSRSPPSKEAFRIDKHDTSNFSMGLIQRKIIHLSSQVEEVVNVFTNIDKHIRTMNSHKDKEVEDKDDVATNTKDRISSSHSNSSLLYPYVQTDIDYFIIEAHNRAVNLLYIGDFIHAEQLLTVALNLLPYCGKEVECHGGEIRNVYRGVIQRRCNTDDVLSMDGNCLGLGLIGLFEG